MLLLQRGGRKLLSVSSRDSLGLFALFALKLRVVPLKASIKLIIPILLIE